jgi:hypothetical protein
MGKREHESTTFYLALTLLGEGSATVPIALVKSPACSQKRGAGSVCSTPQPADNRIKGCDVLQVEPRFQRLSFLNRLSVIDSVPTSVPTSTGGEPSGVNKKLPAIHRVADPNTLRNSIEVR